VQTEAMPELLARLVDLAETAINSPGLWYLAAAVGVASAALPFLRGMYAVSQREKSRRHIADHVASGKLSPIDGARQRGEATADKEPGEGFHTAAWTLGPLGGVLLIGGTWLGSAVHPAFHAIGLGGAIALTLGYSFAVIARAKRRPGSAHARPAQLETAKPIELESSLEATDLAPGVRPVATLTER
jgi:hypothetical protein